MDKAVFALVAGDDSPAFFRVEEFNDSDGGVTHAGFTSGTSLLREMVRLPVLLLSRREPCHSGIG